MLFYKVRDEGKTEQEDQEYRGAKGLNKDSKEVIDHVGSRQREQPVLGPGAAGCLGSAESPGHQRMEPGREGACWWEGLPEGVSRGRQIMGPRKDLALTQ